MPDPESDRKRDLECLRLASELIELATETLNPALKAHCLRMAAVWTDRRIGPAYPLRSSDQRLNRPASRHSDRRGRSAAADACIDVVEEAASRHRGCRRRRSDALLESPGHCVAAHGHRYARQHGRTKLAQRYATAGRQSKSSLCRARCGQSPPTFRRTVALSQSLTGPRRWSGSCARWSIPGRDIPIRSSQLNTELFCSDLKPQIRLAIDMRSRRLRSQDRPELLGSDRPDSDAQSANGS